MPQENIDSAKAISHKPSNTAYGAASALVVAKHSLSPHLVPTITEKLTTLFLQEHRKQVKDVMSSLLLKTINALPYATQNLLVNTFLFTHWPLAETLANRKHYIQSNVERFIKEHVDAQIVVFGGGYDTMPLRLSLTYPGVQFFESDLGATRDIKHKVLNAIKTDNTHPLYDVAKARDNLHFAEIDITEDGFIEKLQKTGVDKNKPTLFILEGVSMYIDNATLATFLDTLKETFNQAHHEIAIDFIESLQAEDSNCLQQCLRRRNKESYQSALSLDEAMDFLTSHGFKPTYHLSYGDMNAKCRGRALEVNAPHHAHQFIARMNGGVVDAEEVIVSEYDLAVPNYN